MQSLAKHCTECKTTQRPETQTRRGLVIYFAQNLFCKIFMIQTVQAGAV
ncbi:hypothetical protein GSA81_004093 [Salmonella enterica]|uniref:Uncharacterized protein n=2 Tax=Salmonella enterica TaxID=28901 RepID=A0A742HVX0_SALER|nr:hypothetical protein [Salmonella enterica]EDQ4053005.1 hypothetical protein [Salmonella enterica subsp. enterica serovar Miami]EDS6612067.1 hypothetical protein [Salmonella enterica subsp. enterica serovar Bareilly]EDX5568782.1 hypothetical protein [Salmonella enterica subsp. enterica serovar Alabama]EED8332184.1 hypothetical protein [Salmonella enterica subsp. enterica serovar Thompson]HAE6952457.1 hypothetical protein [Salmonella enterica subsp. enterica serovar Typhisuis]